MEAFDVLTWFGVIGTPKTKNEIFSWKWLGTFWDKELKNLLDNRKIYMYL